MFFKTACTTESKQQFVEDRLVLTQNYMQRTSRANHLNLYCSPQIWLGMHIQNLYMTVFCKTACTTESKKLSLLKTEQFCLAKIVLLRVCANIVIIDRLVCTKTILAQVCAQHKYIFSSISVQNITSYHTMSSCIMFDIIQ